MPEKKPTLQVTQCQVFVVREGFGKTKALARIILNDELQLTSLRVVDGANGLFVATPTDPSYKGDDYKSIFYPITRELRDHIEAVVIATYKKAISGKALTEEDRVEVVP